MHNHEEPIVSMARVICERAVPGTTYDLLPQSQQYHWQVTAARGWEAYWQQCEYRENPTGRHVRV